MESFKFSKEIAGRNLTIETGKLANQAQGSVTVSYGDTVVLGTAVISNETRQGIDFFPLTVEFEERLYAVGRIKGSKFIKRDTRPGDEAVLNGRMIDRAIRPLFSEDLRNEVQVIITVLSVDPENPSKIVGLIAASAALAISNIPWDGPIAGLNVGLKDGKYILNPTVSELNEGNLELTLAGTKEKFVMIEAEAKEVPEQNVLEAFKFGQKALGEIVDLINEAVKKVGKTKSTLTELMPQDTEEMLAKKKEIIKVAEEFIATQVNPYLLNEVKPTKALRKHGMHEIMAELHKELLEKGYDEDLVHYALDKTYKIIDQKVSAAILERESRVDGRKLNQIRPLSFEVGLLKRLHGSGLFQRGETQVLSVVTLGGPGDAQVLDSMEDVGEKRYMHHYTFAPFAVNEVKQMRGLGRREIGHGALAEKALVPVLPTKEEFPYTIRVVSETLGSNGSSSMASTCGSTLALLDAGVPLKSPVVGIAMGLATDGKGKYKIITDLQDLEDGPGGMDFKVTGTKNGITAIQMDTKTDGLTIKMVEETLTQGREALDQILKEMAKVIAEPRAEMSPFAPRITSFTIDTAKIKDVIGPGGKVINKIIAETGVDIDIDDSGLVMVTSNNAEMSAKAVLIIKNIVKVPEAGEIYKGKVVRIMDFGAFVEILPGKDGMVHISRLAPGRVNKVTDILDEGMEVTVKVNEIDSQGRINLSLVEGGKTYIPGSSSSFDSDDRGRGDRGGFGSPRPSGGGDRKRFFKRRDDR
ncbi:MAG: polyribonucleotide nucleotidyltransferase [Candidatus Parcubacteria bacterium]|nr:polyribonucleotide nucleotidyltransferase [Candidatus Parcubacteria bacterium]